MAETPQDVFNLDDPRFAAATFVISFKGVRVPIDRRRLLELLTREDGYFGAIFQGEGAARSGTPRADTGGDSAMPQGRQMPGVTVTHASLSGRIKKIFEYSSTTMRLRPAHLGLLRDLIGNFDWRIPKHPNTKLEQHLETILTWQDVPRDFKKEAEVFLKRYGKLRQGGSEDK